MRRDRPQSGGRPPQPGSPQWPTILIIGDDEKLNHLLKRFLKDDGYEIYAAVDADEGLKTIQSLEKNRPKNTN